MIRSVDVEIPNELMQKFLEEKTGPQGLFATPAEYIRDLIRRDFESDEQQRWHNLYEQLKPGLDADESEFEEFDLPEFLQEARQRRSGAGRKT
jgi:Arc/MetJ-type ribon-helix-helix transcriptional regulator